MSADDWRWPSIDVVRALHAKLINDFGGLHGETGPGDLEAVLARPANLANYGESDSHELAAALAEALVRGHAFTDGNKRIGFTAALVFLRLNGRPLPALGQARATERTLALAAGAITRADYAQWLRGDAAEA